MPKTPTSRRYSRDIRDIRRWRFKYSPEYSNHLEIRSIIKFGVTCFMFDRTFNRSVCEISIINESRCPLASIVPSPVEIGSLKEYVAAEARLGNTGYISPSGSAAAERVVLHRMNSGWRCSLPSAVHVRGLYSAARAERYGEVVRCCHRRVSGRFPRASESRARPRAARASDEEAASLSSPSPP